MLKVTNTLTGKVEPFTVEGDTVRMYVCGITPYDSCHIGHARCYVVFDVIRRYLEFKKYNVLYVQNFTDIDDKIISRANELNISWRALSSKYIEEYFVNSSRLNIKPASKYPRVTDYIPYIINFIDRLLSKNVAYIARNGDVYFSVASFPGYGKLSHRNVEELLIGARVEPTEEKRNPLDFALWKAAKPGEPFWESPWGPGRPGWHIECSTMSLRELETETLDIHGGGQDLIFPHHENEIAQSESLTGKPFSRYWIHNGFITVRQEKMSKSLGNVYTLSKVFEEFNPMVVRYYLLTVHYRKYLEFNYEALLQVKAALRNLCTAVEEADKILGKDIIDIDLSVYPTGELLLSKFEDAMDDDFNTELALSVVHEVITQMNVILHSDRKDLEKLKIYRKCVKVFLEEVLGIDLSLYLENERQRLSPEEIRYVEELIKRRDEMRKSKNWAEADKIRDELHKMGIQVEDTKEGTRWRKL